MFSDLDSGVSEIFRIENAVAAKTVIADATIEMITIKKLIFAYYIKIPIM